MKHKTMSKKHNRHSSKRSDLDSRYSTDDSDNYKHILKERHYKDDDKNKRRGNDSDSKHSSHSHKSRRSKSPQRDSQRKNSPPSKKSKNGTYKSSHNRSHKPEGDVNESYEELSRRKRKLESELRALDLEEAAEKEAENKKVCREKSDNSKRKEIPDVKVRKEPDAKVRKGPDVRVRKELDIKDRKEPDVKVRKEPDVKVRKEPDVKVRKEPDVKVRKELDVKVRKELDVKVRKEPDVKVRKEPDVKVRKEPDVKVKKEPDVKVKKEPAVKIKKERFSDEERTERKSSKSKSSHSATKTDKDKHKSEASRSSEDEKGWGTSQQGSKVADKEKPNFEVSGKLAEETNTYNGVVIKYNEPAEARKPKRRWRLYPFKGDSDLPFIPIHRQSAYLFGRTRLIADIPIDHPSCSKQHAVLQFRLVPYKRDDGSTGRRVRPYIIDLESSNGTYVNNNKIDPRCYVELVEKDVIKFGYSSREYVLLHEESKYSELDDDVLDVSD